jgi:hypothetical protein
MVMPNVKCQWQNTSKLVHQNSKSAADVRIFFSSVGTCTSLFCGYYILVAEPVTTTAVFIATCHAKEATPLHVL